MPEPRISGALVAVCSAVALASCAPNTLDREKVQEAIKGQTPGVELASVECPPGVAPKAGESFTCIATASNGATILVTVEQKDDKGTVGFVIGKGYLRTEGIAAQLRSGIGTAREATVEVSCPPAVALKDNTGTFTCEGKDQGGDKFEVTVKVTDGKVAPNDYEVVPKT